MPGNDEVAFEVLCHRAVNLERTRADGNKAAQAREKRAMARVAQSERRCAELLRLHGVELEAAKAATTRRIAKVEGEATKTLASLNARIEVLRARRMAADAATAQLLAEAASTVESETAARAELSLLVSAADCDVDTARRTAADRASAALADADADTRGVLAELRAENTRIQGLEDVVAWKNALGGVQSHRRDEKVSAVRKNPPLPFGALAPLVEGTPKLQHPFEGVGESYAGTPRRPKPKGFRAETGYKIIGAHVA